MTETREKLVIITTHAEEVQDKATIPFALGSAALTLDKDVVIILQSTAVHLATKGYAERVNASGFPPLNELLEIFFESGGKLMVCSPCAQARNIGPEDLISNVDVISGAALVAESMAAETVLTY
ncbi:hypothetical protein D1AOALGA4SA_122 [Olavius algarvensis Delta 1 endosymbiont]|nr:hypothetical protein D1AOALGA4SA_122 [Olavius algarvensis Delta 1 endosymbiont]